MNISSCIEKEFHVKVNFPGEDKTTEDLNNILETNSLEMASATLISITKEKENRKISKA